MTTTRTIVSCLHRRTSTLASTATTTPTAHHVKTSPNTETAKPFHEMPGPTGFRNLPIIGMALNFKPFTEYGPFQLTEVFTMLRNRYGDIYRTRMGKENTVNICHPEIAEELLRLPSKENKRVVMAIAETTYKRNNIHSRALSQLNGLEWETTRKIVQQKLMKTRCLNMFFPSINWSSDSLVEKLEEQGNVNDMLYELQKYSADSIGMVALNRDLGCIQNTSPVDLSSVIDPILKCIHETFFLPLNTYKYFRTKLYNEFESNFLILHNFVVNLTEEQTALLKKVVDEGRLAEHMEKHYNVFHDLMIEGKLSPEKIVAIIFDFFVGGINSSASLMLFLLVDLANNPHKQRILYDEVKQVVGNKSEVTKEDYDKLSYLKACVKESHRMRYPTMLGMVRFMETDVTVAGYSIPKNTQVIVHNEMMCYDERFFKNPNEYIPERWMRGGSGDEEGNKQPVHPFIIKPFGYGARSCLGQRLAEIQMITCIAKIVKNFQVNLPAGQTDIKWNRHVFPVPDDKVKMCLDRRQS